MKSKHIIWTLGLKCDYQNWPWPWLWPWIFKINHGICYISPKVVLLSQNEKQTYWLNSRPPMWPSELTLAMTLTLNFQGQNWKILTELSDCHETKNECINSTLGLKCNHHILNSCISGMAGPIDVKWKGSKSICFWANNVTLTFDHMHGLHHGFSRSNFEIAISQEWEGWTTKMWVSHSWR